MKKKDAILDVERANRIKGATEEAQKIIAITKLRVDEEIKAERFVRNAKEGSDGKGIFGIGKKLAESKFGSEIGGINLASLGVSGGVAAGIAGGALLLEKGFESELKLEQELKQVAIGYQTLGLSAKEAFLAARGDESLIESEANKFALLTSSLREAEGAYLKFGGNSDNLKQKLELIIGVATRTGEGCSCRAGS